MPGGSWGGRVCAGEGRGQHFGHGFGLDVLEQAIHARRLSADDGLIAQPARRQLDQQHPAFLLPALPMPWSRSTSPLELELGAKPRKAVSCLRFSNCRWKTSTVSMVALSLPMPLSHSSVSP